ncbi:hypothetical protein AVEN_87180-1, partial [Araneus ventricosus]
EVCATFRYVLLQHAFLSRRKRSGVNASLYCCAAAVVRRSAYFQSGSGSIFTGRRYSVRGQRLQLLGLPPGFGQHSFSTVIGVIGGSSALMLEVALQGKAPQLLPRRCGTLLVDS